jgi:hypothetical protein
MKEAQPELIDSTELMGEILGLSGQGVRVAARMGLVPVVQIGSAFFATRSALMEARRRGHYWCKAKRRREALARIAAEDAAQAQMAECELV